jgi:hypothetical protein
MKEMDNETLLTNTMCTSCKNNITDSKALKISEKTRVAIRTQRIRI